MTPLEEAVKLAKYWDDTMLMSDLRSLARAVLAMAPVVERVKEVVEQKEILAGRLSYKAKELDREVAERDRLREWAQGVADYQTTEVCKDEFAYDRLMATMKEAASKALRGGGE